MADNNEVKKTAKTIMLNDNRAIDREALKNLTELRDVVPGLSDLAGALRWLCEKEIPAIIDKYKKFNQTLKAS